MIYLIEEIAHLLLHKFRLAKDESTGMRISRNSISMYMFIRVTLNFVIMSSKLKSAYNSVKKSKFVINN